jgi:ABC-type antimicrobial peptide transport system permease subunit
VQALRGVRGHNYLGFRLTDDAAAAQSRVITEVRAYLTAQTGTDPITALPATRAPGQWPGQSRFNHVMALLYIITILAFLSALFLISATMNALIAEQAGNIAILTGAQITAADKSILTIVEILGLVVVAIMLMGLVSALSMGVIERTRETGILRCLGARARQIRRVFSAEAVALAVVGWAFGILLGWLIYEGLLALLLHDVGVALPVDFLPVIPLITLAGLLVLTLIVIRGSLRRATRIQPGTALRYQ